MKQALEHDENSVLAQMREQIAATPMPTAHRRLQPVFWPSAGERWPAPASASQRPQQQRFSLCRRVQPARVRSDHGSQRNRHDHSQLFECRR